MRATTITATLGHGPAQRSLPEPLERLREDFAAGRVKALTPGQIRELADGEIFGSQGDLWEAFLRPDDATGECPGCGCVHLPPGKDFPNCQNCGTVGSCTGPPDGPWCGEAIVEGQKCWLCGETWEDGA